MAAAIRAAHPDVEIELIRGGRGVFTVIADGDELWNKHARGGFPSESEIVAQLASRAG